jgi:hypothetical protein
MRKQVAIGRRPTAKPEPVPADQWVEHRATAEDSEPMKRLTIDVPASLHRAIKGQCGMRGTKIADEVRDLLLQKYGKS